MPKDGRIKKDAAVTLQLAVIVGHLYVRRRKIKAQNVIKDIREAEKSVCISSPRLSRQRVLDFKKRLIECNRTQTEFIVWTLPNDDYAEHQRKGIEFMKKTLKDIGINIWEHDNLNCRFAVIDSDLVWYGNMNFLSKEHDENILMRLRSEEIVRELLSIVK